MKAMRCAPCFANSGLIRRLISGLCALGVAAGAAPALAAAPVAANPGAARLQGSFLLAGRVTVARNVRGVRVGQNVMRTWNFIPACSIGACRTVVLRRGRTGGADTVTLHRRSLGYYTGTGSFDASLRCGTHTYRRGQSVPFVITVRVTAAVLSAGIVVATRVAASYTNRSRTNLTPCVAELGHDAATYHGHLIPPAPATGGAGP
jgi:hypothetical protein